MDDHTAGVERGAILGVLKAYVYLAFEALRALGDAVGPFDVTPAAGSRTPRSSSSDVSLLAVRVLSDALAEQIACATERAVAAADQHVPIGASDSVTAEQFAACLERHITVLISQSANVTLTLSERIRQFIEAHYAEPLTLADLAAAVGCARSQVAAVVKAQIGETTHRYIVRVRIRRAADLIAQGDKIEAVMLSVGYRSKKNFYHQFKLETGLTPALYRRGRRHPAPAPADAAVTWHPMATSVTVSRASELLGVSRRTVYYWIKNGKLQTTRQLDGGQRILVASFPVCGSLKSA